RPRTVGTAVVAVRAGGRGGRGQSRAAAAHCAPAGAQPEPPAPRAAPPARTVGGWIPELAEFGRPRVSGYRDVSFTDELLSDGSVHRRFSDGREEWRWRGPGPLVSWRDNAGASGTDEALGGRIVKRIYSDGRAVYGREQGYGRTAWSDRTLT